MTQVPKFGFSAYLKLINSQPRPQNTIIRKRYMPSEGGFDFHKSFRTRVQQASFHGLSVEAVLASTEQIRKLPERNSARRALEQFFEWKALHPGMMETASGVCFPSPAGLFKVEFTPDFLLRIGDRRTAVHLWNTRHPLAGNLVRAALSAVANRYPLEKRPEDFAVLSLQNRTLYRWSESDRETQAFGERLMEILDMQFSSARVELGLPARPEREVVLPSA
ncbi:hypothetical protein J2J97_09130 [Rhizobium bangladeshense]|uniref:hypothetical protein n=1 Tax=Rhizobium bangladeshense TaxID=1138189 RepID=UPI001A9A1E58|nr:hypothetical protein [Rhizobium bangladeshense]QSY96048.1 hypothetical protein J2J97_09130 [Rhizobium bangladeshense]